VAAPSRYALLDLEVTRPLPAVRVGAGEAGVAVLVRRHGVPLRLLHRAIAPGASLTAAELGRLVADAGRFDLMREAVIDELGRGARTAVPTLSLCLRGAGRPETLRACLERLVPALCGDGDGDGGDIAVIGAAPVAGIVRAFPGVRWVPDESVALREAREEHVAFVAQGVLLDDGWRAGVADALARHPDAAAVTGPLVPLSPSAGPDRELLERRWEGMPQLAGARAAATAAASDAQLVLRRSAAAPLGSLPSGAAPMLWRLLDAGGTVVETPRALAYAAPGDRRLLRRLSRSWGAALAGASVMGPERRGPALRRAAAELRGARRADVDLVLAGLAGAADALRQRARGVSATGPRIAPKRWAPVDVLHLDLAAGLSVPPGPRGALAVLWWGDVPLGHVAVSATERALPQALASLVAGAIAPAVGERLLGAGFDAPVPSRFPAPPPPAPPLDELLAVRAPLHSLGAALEAQPSPAGPAGPDPAAVSVVVCTRDRADELARCLASLSELAVAPREVIVVDNAPGDGATAAVAARFPGVAYVPEPRPGLSVARNTGIRAASGRIIAFVDDDTLVHPRWLERLLLGFGDPDVLAVTGLVLPSELESPSQVVFEERMGSAGRGYRPMRFDAAFFAPQRRIGVPVWAIGAGANMALRREAFALVGDYDERLGAGAAGCSEDSELWYRILAAGGACRYVPDAVVLHRHRREAAALQRQAHDYLRGHVAALFVQGARMRHPGNLRRALITIPAYLLRRVVGETLTAPSARTGTLGAELTGYAAGLASLRLVLRPRAGRSGAAGARRPPARRPPSRDGAPDGPAVRAPRGR